MPGRTSTEAVNVFLEPIQRAVGCVGVAKVTLSPKGRSALGRTHLLTLNSGKPVTMSNRHLLDVRLHYEIVRTEASAQPFRVTTRAYLHRVLDPRGVEVISAHWHPTGSSAVDFPHWHIGSAALASDGVFTSRAHVPSPSVSVEDMVYLCLTQFGCEPQREDWRTILDASEAAFRSHKSW